MSPTTVVITCECNSMDCLIFVEMSDKEYLAISESGKFVVVDGCQTPPMKGDKFVEQRLNYSVWQESK